MIRDPSVRKLRRLHWAVALLVTKVALAQMNTGQIAGIVQDPSGAILPGATILAQHSETQQKFTAVSNNAGEYLFPQLAAGTYSLKASAANFKQSMAPKGERHAGDRLRRDFPLEVGDATEVLEVRAGAGGVQLESAEI